MVGTIEESGKVSTFTCERNCDYINNNRKAIARELPININYNNNDPISIP